MCNDFSREYLALPDTLDPRLRSLAVRYHAECDIYAQMVCSGVSVKGEPAPRDNYETQKINQHASRVIHRLAVSNGVSEVDLRDAIKQTRSCYG